VLHHLVAARGGKMLRDYQVDEKMAEIRSTSLNRLWGTMKSLSKYSWW